MSCGVPEFHDFLSSLKSFQESIASMKISAMMATLQKDRPEYLKVGDSDGGLDHP